MPRESNRKSPSLKNVFIVVGVIMFIVGASMMFVVEAEEDVPWSRWFLDPGGDDTTTDSTDTTTTDTTTTTDPTNTTTTTDPTDTTTTDPTNTTTTDTSSTTTDPDPNTPTGVAGLAVYGLDEAVGMVLITPEFVEAGLFTDGYCFIEFLMEPVVIGDVTPVSGQVYDVTLVVDRITAVPLVGDGEVVLLDAPVSVSAGGTVVAGSASYWTSGHLFALTGLLPGTSFTLEGKLKEMGWMFANRDIWNYVISVEMHSEIVIGDFTAVIERHYTLEFTLGDEPGSGTASIHSLSLTDDAATMLTYAQWLMLASVGVIAVCYVPFDSLLKSSKRLNSSKRRVK